MINQNLARNDTGAVLGEEKLFVFPSKEQGVPINLVSEWILTKNSYFLIAKRFLVHDNPPESFLRVAHEARPVQNFGYTNNAFGIACPISGAHTTTVSNTTVTITI